MKLRFFTLLLLYPLLPLLSETVEVKDHIYPKTETVFDVEWNLQGTHHFKYKIFFSIFTGAYYESTSGESERLVFTYTRDIEANDLRKQAMKHLTSTNSEETLSKYENLTEEIQSAYEDVRDGDRYSITVINERGTWLSRNDEVVFTTDDVAFGKWYMDIWLGTPPISEELKEALVNE